MVLPLPSFREQVGHPIYSSSIDLQEINGLSEVAAPIGYGIARIGSRGGEGDHTYVTYVNIRHGDSGKTFYGKR